MKKGRLKEEDTVKISITAKRAEDELDDYVKKFIARKKRKKSN